MKRLYYLTSSMDNVASLVHDLHQDGISDWHLHVLSLNEAGLYHRQIHSASIIQQNDVIHSGEQGVMVGAAIGLLVALLLEWFPPFGWDLNFPALAAIGSVFTLFGAWSGGLAGSTRENYKVARFHDSLEQGQHLMMVDVNKQQEATIKNHIHDKHPEAQFMGADSPWILPFGFRSHHSKPS